jgi:hypothetical protein
VLQQETEEATSNLRKPTLVITNDCFASLKDLLMDNQQAESEGNY